MKYKNVIIASSATGGHIYPGIVLAREFKKNGYNPIFFITNNKVSIEILQNNCFEYVLFNFSGMPRKISFSFIMFLVKLKWSFLKSLIYILIFKPIVVIGTGGYMSVPVILASKIFKKKTFIHEQNSIPGKANKFLNKLVDKTFISFEYSKKYLKNCNTLFSGYPIRDEVLKAFKEESLKKLCVLDNVFTVLVFGGSLGAAKLNNIACKAFIDLSKDKQVQVIHITGNKNYLEVAKLVSLNENYKIFKYMHNIYDAYAVSDVVVCRCGAGTLFELKALNKPAVFVPYPHATDNHQYWNAKEIEEYKKFVVIEEKDLTEKKLKEEVKTLYLSLNAKKFASYSQLPQELIFKEIIKCIRS